MRPQLAALAGISLALVGAPQAAAAPPAIYAGHTGGDAPFALRVSADGRKLQQLLVHADTKCDDASDTSWAGRASFAAFKPVTPDLGKNVFSPARVSRRGSFRATGLVRDGYDETDVGTSKETLRGTIHRGVAHGTYSITTEIVDANGAKVATCRSGIIRWEAYSSPARTYAGLTSAGQPVVVQRTRDRRRVDHVWMSWDADCQGGGFFAFGEEFVNFPVSSSGRFGNPFEDDVNLDDGGTRTYAYALTGDVGARQASGTFRVQVTDRDPAGTATDTCDSTLLHWTASSTKGRAPKSRPGGIRRV